MNFGGGRGGKRIKMSLFLATNTGKSGPPQIHIKEKKRSKERKEMTQQCSHHLFTLHN